MAATYCIELAKSGRSQCKKCSDKIAEKEIRIGTKKLITEFVTTTWAHLKCFQIPKNRAFLDFMDCLEGFMDLDEQSRVEVNKVLESGRSAVGSAVTGVKREADAQGAGSSPKKRSIDGATPETYEMYSKMTLDSLKDHLRWNNQQIGGNKSELVDRCVEGHTFGALPRCPETECGGKLILNLEARRVECHGSFNEELGSRVRCYYRCSLDKIPRLPWRTEPISEEEKLAAAAEAEKASGISSTDDLFSGIELGTIDGKRRAVALLIAKAIEVGINLPESEADARVKIGALFMSDASRPSSEILKAAAKQFGTKSKEDEQKKSSQVGTACPANAGIVAALSELGVLYFKLANAQAGNTYRKAAAAIRSLEFPVTSGKAISKGKGKVEGVGDKCGLLIDEFLETGTMSKLEEKRAEVARQ